MRKMWAAIFVLVTLTVLAAPVLDTSPLGTIRGARASTILLPGTWPWWRVPGLDPASVVAAWEPKRATTLSQSLTSIIGSAVLNNHAGGISLTNGAGWVTDGTGYLTSSIAPTANTVLIVRYSGLPSSMSTLAYLAGSNGGTSDTSYLLVLQTTSPVHRFTNRGSYFASYAPMVQAGTAVMAGTSAWMRVGTATPQKLTGTATGISTTTFVLYFFGRNNNGTANGLLPSGATISSVIILSSAPSDSILSALIEAMP